MPLDFEVELSFKVFFLMRNGKVVEKRMFVDNLVGR